MKSKTQLFCISFIGLLTLFSCKEPEARLPISQSKSSQINKSIELNKALIEDEESLIKKYIEQDSIKQYLNTSSGFWYTYNERHLEDTYLNNTVLYTETEIGTLRYLVDQEDQLKGIRHAIKLLKKGEKASFLFPSHLAYSYTGDNNKIGKNQPIIVNLNLISVEVKN